MVPAGGPEISKTCDADYSKLRHLAMGIMQPFDRRRQGYLLDHFHAVAALAATKPAVLLKSGHPSSNTTLFSTYAVILSMVWERRVDYSKLRDLAMGIMQPFARRHQGNLRVNIHAMAALAATRPAVFVLLTVADRMA